MNEGAAAPLPEWVAPAHWRAIDFVSDLHLAPELPRTIAAWARLLHETTADAVVLLGDVFEVWVGDDSRHLPFERSLVERLRVASDRRTIAFMPGNRDFLVGSDLCAAAGLRALADPTCLVAWNHRIVLCHGDAHCLDDDAYQAFRREVRHPRWQQDFLQRPLPERIELARAMRRASRERRDRGDVEGGGDLDTASCRELLVRAHARTLLHGHTHRPGRHELGNGLERVVLCDWDVDDALAPRAEVVRLTPDGSLRRLTVDEACDGTC